MIELKGAVKEVASNFKYVSDDIVIFDSWVLGRVDKNKNYSGDCEDFSLTVFWILSGKNIWKFLFNLLVTHSYRLYNVKTTNGEPHVVGYYKGQYFDNWSLRVLPKKEFFEETKHKMRFMYIAPVMIPYLLIGLVL